MSQIIDSLLALLETRDASTAHHCRRVSRLSAEAAHNLHLSELDISNLRHAGLLHDIGKLSVSDTILFKMDSLTVEEWSQVRTHSLLGSTLAASIDILAECAPLILAHHERFDGKGYPNRLAGEEIPYLARILAIADATDSMLCSRPYRMRRSLEQTLAELQRESGLQFDPAIVPAFLDLSPSFWEAYLREVE